MTYPIGTHLKISRASGLYTHHGIYVSNGEVIHYAGFCEIFKYEPIGQVSLTEFQRKATHIDVISHHDNYIDTPEEIVCRAKSRLHENKYSLLRNNCEHASWCIHTDKGYIGPEHKGLIAPVKSPKTNPYPKNSNKLIKQLTDTE